MAAGVFAALAVILWFVFRIPTVAGDLSGRNARKSVEQMRNKAVARRSGDTGLPEPGRPDTRDGPGDPEETVSLEVDRIVLIEKILYIHTEDVI